jgi:VanZ family protein
VSVAVASRARLWLPVILWAGVIFALSSIPSLDSGLGDWDLPLRKLAHAAEFGLLAVLLYRATRSAPVALALASVYAVTDELHQSFVSGRQAAVRDWAIDTVGAALGLAILFLWRRRR